MESLFNKVVDLSTYANTVWKVSKYGNFPGPYFPVSRLNTEIYGVNIRIQSKYGKIRTRKNSVFEHFSRSENFAKYQHFLPTIRNVSLPEIAVQVLRVVTLLKRDCNTTVSSWILQNFKNIFFKEHLQAAASKLSVNLWDWSFPANIYIYIYISFFHGVYFKPKVPLACYFLWFAFWMPLIPKFSNLVIVFT